MGIALDNGVKKHHMGQRYAKHQMQSGIRVYHQRHYQRAIGRWRSALSRLRNAEDRFITLGFMAQAFCDCGDYESMLHYALQQMELANARNDDFMKSEALLNLSKAYERLADYGKAIGYGRASLQHPNIDARTPGYAHLGIAMAYLGLSHFQTALEEFECAMAVANDTGDKLLELQICIGLGILFTLLRDLSKALIFLRNALSILQLITIDSVHAKYKCTILYQLSVVLRLKGSLADARQVCDEALRLSYQTSNRATYARALTSMADINRELGESEAKETITKSWARYEQSFRIMHQIKDRMGEVIVLSSMAKSASESRSHYTGQCECQAIQLNQKCLELTKMIGCKHAMLKCHLRLQELYEQLEDEENEDHAAKSCVALIQEMELFCNFCGQRYGDRDDSLQALRCSHIFHERCLQKFLTEDEQLCCPKCKSKAIVIENHAPRTNLYVNDYNSNMHEAKSLKIQSTQQQKKDETNKKLFTSIVPSEFDECRRIRATIPRTKSAPIYETDEIIYTPNHVSREYGTTDDVYLFTDKDDFYKNLSSVTSEANLSYPTVKSVKVHPRSKYFSPSTEVTALSSSQQFSLSASTTSVKFYSSIPKQNSLNTNLEVPCINSENLIISHKFPSRTKRIQSYLKEEQQVPKDILHLKRENAIEEKQVITSQHQKSCTFNEENEIIDPQKCQPLNTTKQKMIQLDANKQIEYVNNKSKMKPSSIRKACAKDFPQMSRDLLNLSPPSLAFSTMLERAMCPVIEENLLTCLPTVEDMNLEQINSTSADQPVSTSQLNKDKKIKSLFVLQHNGITDL